MKKNGVKTVVINYKNGVKTETVHNDTSVNTVIKQRLESDMTLLRLIDENSLETGF